MLREIGFPETLKDKDGRIYEPQNAKDVAGWLACGAIAVVILGLIILGVIKLSEIIR